MSLCSSTGPNRFKLAIHTSQWTSCNKCPLGERALKRCFYDVVSFPEDETDPNKLPIIMCIGEGPGINENATGLPFVGVAGELLRKTFMEAHMDTKLPFQLVLSNLVACRPQDKFNGTNRAPEEGEIKSCSPRVNDLLKIFTPEVMVYLGQVPQKYKELYPFKGKVVDTYHPSFIVRTGRTSSSYYERFLNNITQAVLFTEKPPYS